MQNKDYNNIPAYGEIDENGYVHLGGTENGFCYKNPHTYFFDTGAICYIGEFNNRDIPECAQSDNNGNYLYADYKKYDCGWTANEILEVCNNNKYAADVVFSLIDWQCPETKYLEILEETDELDNDYKLIHS